MLQRVAKSAITIVLIVCFVDIVAIIIFYADVLLKVLRVSSDEERVPITGWSLPSLVSGILPIADLGIFVMYAIMVVLDIVEVSVIRLKRLWARIRSGDDGHD